MYELYIANKNYSSWSLRPWVLLRQLGIPFDERLQHFGGANYDRFRQFSPTGLVPCLVDGATTVWDSLAIAEYVAEHYPRVWPLDATARAYARSAAAEMHSGFGPLRSHCGMSCGLRIRLHELPAPVRQNLARLSELWNQGLARFGGPFLAGGTFTAVDAFFCPVAFRVQTYDLALDGPAADYARRLLALPAMQDWYRDALAETFRDPEHESDFGKLGTIVQDLRAKA